MRATFLLTTPSLLFAALTIFARLAAGQQPARPPEAPETLAPLVQAGRITWELYDEKPDDLSYDGETHFEIKLDYKFRTQLRPARLNGSVVQQVSVAFFSIKATVENRVRLPRTQLEKGFWQSQLVLHEMQHVQITSDPRVPLLVKSLLQRGSKLNFPANTTLSESHIKDEIATQVNAVAKIVSDLVQANNDLLDQLTQHGTALLDGDPQFFRRLYTESNLKDQQFPRINDVQQLLRTKQYRRLSGFD